MTERSKKRDRAPGTSRTDPDIGAFVGTQIRQRRRFIGLTISELAKSAGLSVSNLSKIETGQVTPSLQSLNAIAKAFRSPVNTFFRGFDEDGSIVHIKKNKGMVVARSGEATGHTLELLAEHTGQISELRPYLLTVETTRRQHATFTFDGTEFIYMLSGAMEFRYGTRLIEVREGESLLFDGNTLHGPERATKAPATYLSVSTHKRNDA